MALISRLSRLFQADFHAVLDRIEEPDLQLRHAVREMQFALDQDQRRLKLLQHEHTRLNKAAADAVSNIEGFDKELDICLAAREDDLARDLIKRKLGAKKQLQALQQQAASINVEHQNLNRQIDEQNQQLTSMKQKLELLAGDDSFASGKFNHANAIRNEEVEIALLREKEHRAES